ncbi:uncharacterized protein LOC142477237 [Ascaphus truei]|uniref:uncharacterized protein LOC142477237 n=1 Tax=Ascaphus truei TaxID=8439 RepID=UPI003F5AA361
MSSGPGRKNGTTENLVPEFFPPTDPAAEQLPSTPNEEPKSWNPAREINLSELITTTVDKRFECYVTMSHEVSWRVFLLLSLSSFSYSQNCKWLQPHQERLNQLILQNFNLMSPVEEFPLACILNTTFPPNIDALYSISQVGAAALAVREVTNQTNWFYIKHHESLRCRQQAWERLQALLHYQGNQLAECIPEGAENHLQKEAASKYFHTLEEIVQEQDNNVCARNIIRMEVGRNLRLAAQLSSRMGRG